ncbi:hypothetical protein OG735_22665 [Streptomyces sp. NBC_01210]|uniref:hypothetical protein n=1 Tax=Streptomyces sp. NBC_01210 TaxID=2903774 RepID=UPI002E124822|nr:hypothetical protein OG735_22665 [Streptomyces sp. NBC_01210]
MRGTYMLAIARNTARLAVAATAVAALTVAVPPAFAAEDPTGTDVDMSVEASKETREFAAANPGEVAAAANACGSGYTLTRAIPLPVGTDPRLRLATVFTYNSQAGGCLIFDNNTGRAQSMTAKVCDGYPGTKCDSDSGTFSEYAGPVYTKYPVCATVTAKMSNFINYTSQYAFSCN